MDNALSDESANRHPIQRIRYELKRRVLTVRRVARVTPNMIRVTLTGPDLADFESRGADDHVKIVVPRPGEEPIFPELGSDGRLILDPVTGPILRDYTPRRFDRDALELDIDFAVHEAGPATEWAERARPGDKLGVGGPRGSMLVAEDFDWYLLIGDETALPAIGRRIEMLPQASRILVLAEVADAAEEQAFARSDLLCRWLHRGASPAGDPQRLVEAARTIDLPAGDGYVWIATETATAKALRSVMVEERGHPRIWIKAAGYWKRGQADFHETHSD